VSGSEGIVDPHDPSRTPRGQLNKSVRFLKTKYELQRCLEQRAKIVTQESGFGAIHEISGKRRPRFDGTILAKTAKRSPSGMDTGAFGDAVQRKTPPLPNVLSRVDAPSAVGITTSRSMGQLSHARAW